MLIQKIILFLYFLTLGFSASADRSQHNPIISDNADEKIQAEVILDNPAGIKLFMAPEADEKPESSPSSPPLATDDPGTPGRNGYEINFITDCDRAHGSQACESGVDAAFGIGDKVQFRISKFRTQNQNDGDPTRKGWGATDVGIKWRFWDKDGLRVAVFPSFRADDASIKINPDGTVIPSDGRSIYIPLIVSKDIGKYTVVANVGRRENLDDANQSSVFTSIAIGRAIGPYSRIISEVASESSHEGRRTDVRIGWVKVLFPNRASRYQTSLFTSVGRSVGSTNDGKTHATLLFGLSFARKPN